MEKTRASGLGLLVFGVSHRTAPVALRERLAFQPDGHAALLGRLAASGPVTEAMLLCTCNRVEFYVAAQDADAAEGLLAAALAENARTSSEELEPHLYARRDAEALHHLFRVASSLDSLVLGEPQILGQVKTAYDVALAAKTAGPVLGVCLPGAFRLARRVRRETGIARHPVSVSSVAVDFARQIFETFAKRKVLIIGAGKMADLAARALAGQGAELIVTNRTQSRAEELAARIGASVHPFADLAGALENADIVISSTGAQRPILSEDLLRKVQKRRRGRLFCVLDIAVPRDVEPGVDIEGLYVADIDDLQKIASVHAQDRREEAERAEVMVEQELGRFLQSFQGRRVGPTITALRARVLGLAKGEAERVLAATPGLGERERKLLLDLAESVAKKILHTPQVALKKGGADPVEGTMLVAAAERLFELSPIEALPGEASAEGPASSLAEGAASSATVASATIGERAGAVGTRRGG
jgi:glutamyl-tRNA reductase